ncbi:MAG: hypothetical protein RR246_00855 [Clostridia bacterium]
MNIDLFLKTLPIMAKGMAGIFIVTGIIILTIYILNKVCKK